MFDTQLDRAVQPILNLAPIVTDEFGETGTDRIAGVENQNLHRLCLRLGLHVARESGDEGKSRDGPTDERSTESADFKASTIVAHKLQRVGQQSIPLVGSLVD
ncbi:MAG: hypothetical protein ACO3F5_07635 [Gemmatimonadaceae bacterium]